MAVEKDKTNDDIISYLEEERQALLAELKNYDSNLDTTNMDVKEIDALILRKRLYDLERHIRIIRRLSGKK